MTEPSALVVEVSSRLSEPRPASRGRGRALFARLIWADLALVAVVVGVALRLRRWAADLPLWLDEQMIGINVRDTGFLDLTGSLLHAQSAPLAWLWAERVAVLTLGSGERALRLIPLLFGVSTLLAAWLAGRRWLGPVGTVALVSLCAVGPSLVRYSAEVKHYSADVCWVLVLVALAGWAVDRADSRRPLAIWWLAAAVAGWFSLAAIFVVPGLAVVLVAVVWRRSGFRTASRAALLGLGWLVSGAVHYAVALRITTNEPHQKGFWIVREGLPPESADLVRRSVWLAGRPAALAADPMWLGGPVAPTVFWGLVIAGVVLATRRRAAYGLLLMAPIGTCAALGLLGLVPIAERLSLWLAPVLLIAVAVALAGAARAATTAARTPLVTVAAGTLAVLALAAGLLVVVQPATVVAAPPSPPDHVDDRAALTWLMARHRPGDITVVTISSNPGVRWYARFGRLRPGYYVRNLRPGPDCPADEFRDTVRGQQRILAYSGIRTAIPTETHLVLEARLAELGRITEKQEFGEGIVWVVELAPPGAPGVTAPGVTAPGVTAPGVAAVLQRQEFTCIRLLARLF